MATIGKDGKIIVKKRGTKRKKERDPLPEGASLFLKKMLGAVKMKE